MRRRDIRLLVTVVLAAVTVAALTVPQADAAPPCKARNLSTGSHSMGDDALANAIAGAAAGDTITVWGICRGEVLTIDKDLVLQGKGSKATLAFTMNVAVQGAVSVVLDHLTITGGRNFGGGGLYVDIATVTLNDTTVTGNSAALGGGIYTNSGVIVLNDSAVIDNIATEGAGIFSAAGTITLNGSIIDGNRATDFMGASGPNFGGGIELFGGVVTINDSTVSGNTADDHGGGIHLAGGQLVVNGASTITGNAPDNCYPTGSVSGCVG